MSAASPGSSKHQKQLCKAIKTKIWLTSKIVIVYCSCYTHEGLEMSGLILRWKEYEVLRHEWSGSEVAAGSSGGSWKSTTALRRLRTQDWIDGINPARFWRAATTPIYSGAAREDKHLTPDVTISRQARVQTCTDQSFNFVGWFSPRAFINWKKSPLINWSGMAGASTIRLVIVGSNIR
jgi:hypothetical protein